MLDVKNEKIRKYQRPGVETEDKKLSELFLKHQRKDSHPPGFFPSQAVVSHIFNPST